MQRLSVREGEVRQKRTQVQLKTRNCRNDEGRNSTRGRQTKAECVHNLGGIFSPQNVFNQETYDSLALHDIERFSSTTQASKECGEGFCQAQECSPIVRLV